MQRQNLSLLENRKKALDLAILQIEKQFGKGSIMKLGENKTLKLSHISTGSLMLDKAIGIGGLPRGRIIEIFGNEASGKTTLALHAIAEAQKLGGIGAIIDAEHALDVSYAQKLGVKLDDLVVCQPDTGEEGLEIAELLIRSGAVDVLVVDSVSALVPKAEIEGNMGDNHIGLHARLMSQALRKLAGAIQKSNTVVIFINQLREKVGVVFGSPEVTTGGRALKFYSSIRLDVRKIETLKNKDELIGNRVRVKVVKNKVAPPFKTAEFTIIFGQGIDRLAEIIDLGVYYDLINKTGSWYSYKNIRLGQGKENAKEFLKENIKIKEEIEKEVMRKLGFLVEKTKESKII